MSLEPGSTFGGATGDMSTYADMISTYILQAPCKDPLDNMINIAVQGDALPVLLDVLDDMVPPVP